MPKMTVNLKGVAICYYKDGLFKVLFPFDPTNHRVKFTFNPDGQHTEIELGMACRTIAITASQAGKTFPDPTGKFSEFIEITAPREAHDNIEKLPAWHDHGALLTINHGQFIPSDFSDCRFGLRLKGGPTTKNSVQIRYAASVLIDDPRISIVINPPLTGFPNPIIFGGTGPDEITFDNSCPKCPTDDDSFDFNLIYKVIKDKTTLGREFAMRRYFWDRPFFPIKLLEVVGWGLGAKKELFDVQPLNNPGRWAVGLPCNLNTAKKSDDLP